MKKTIAFLVFAFVCTVTFVDARIFERTQFEFIHEPIDVVIPCSKKDIDILDMCISGIRNNCSNVRRIIVVSESRYTDNAEWMSESVFPFRKDDIVQELFADQSQIDRYKGVIRGRLGWIYQQLLKLYAPLVIENISSNVLIVDADTVFLRPVSFIGENGAGCFNPGLELCSSYRSHMRRLLPGFAMLRSHVSGISHHMLFQRCVLVDLKNAIETYHEEPMWKALLHCISLKDLPGNCMSEYEIYFHYSLMRSDQFTVRALVWANSRFNFLRYYQSLFSSGAIQDIPEEQRYHYLSAHLCVSGIR